MGLDEVIKKVRESIKKNEDDEKVEDEFINELDEKLQKTQNQEIIYRIKTQRKIAVNRKDILVLMQKFQQSSIDLGSAMIMISNYLDDITKQLEKLVEKSATKEDLEEIKKMQEKLKNIKKYSLIGGDLNIGINPVKLTGVEIGD